jgi:lactoylglutathione lyase
MVRVRNLEQSLDFYCNQLGLLESHRHESETGQFTLVYLYAPNDAEGINSKAPLLELTYKAYTGSRNFGHLAFEVDDIYQTCERLMDSGIVINRPPRDGYMAFIKSPDGISIELLQKDEPLSLNDKWLSMANTGSW